MTTNTEQTLLSVRGEAQRTVTPDQVAIFTTVAATAETKSAATHAVSAILAGITTNLAALGGQTMSVQTLRDPLTWSAQSIQTGEEHVEDPATSRRTATGRHRATVSLIVTVRAFRLTEQVEAVLVDDDAVSIHSVTWSVDDDNPEWGLVRADAIHAALLKGRDYAVALGGAVTRVHHVADAGLLGESGSSSTVVRAKALSGGGRREGVSLDPDPQVLRATIEARLSATIGPLPST
jgi:uncharacterized protein